MQRRNVVRAAAAVAMCTVLVGCPEDNEVESGGQEVAVADDVPEEISAAEVTVPDVPTTDVDAQEPDTEDSIIGTACATAADCETQLCTDIGTGLACTDYCDPGDADSCPIGWSCVQSGSSPAGATYTCEKNQAQLCRPCREDADCGPADLGDRCVDRGDAGSFCGASCGDGCPQGYSCETVNLADGTSAEQCVLPAGSACACNASATAAAASTDCAISNASGTCTGERACSASGLSACSATTPAAETCGGGDENCDGTVDEEDAAGCTTYYLDVDGDTYGIAGDSKCLCAPAGDYKATTTGDCNDGNTLVYPGEACTAAACVDGYLFTGPSLCGGDGSCADVAQAPCPGGYACASATACFDTCTSGDQCAPGHYCDNGQCLGALPDGSACSDDSQCASANCANDFCCTGDSCCGGEDADCDDGNLCTDNTCGTDFVCSTTNNTTPCGESACEGMTFTPATVCADGACPDAVPTECGGDNICMVYGCDATTGCTETPAGTTTACGESVCTGNMLTPAALCDGAGTCSDPAAAAPCPGGLLCADATSCKTTCIEDADCAAGRYCSSGACVPKIANGSSCSSGSQCASGYCNSGLCCDGGTCCVNSTPCDDGNTCTVDTCTNNQCVNANATDGTSCGAGACTGGAFVPGATCQAGSCTPGTPENCTPAEPADCVTYTCDAATGCGTSNVAGNTLCELPSCTDFSYTTQKSCDGVGACSLGGTTEPCAGGFTCLDGQNCRTVCTEESHCQPGFFCDGGTCVADQSNGAACTDNSECESGHCENGFCCDDGKCCNLGVEPGGCDDGDPCTTDLCVESACTTEPSTAICGETGCNGGMLTPAPVCDGAGNCGAPAAATPCPGGFMCADAASCATSCTNTAGCQAGLFCADGACVATLPNGSQCSAPSDCASGHCNNGLCCDGGVCCTQASACADENPCTTDACTNFQCTNNASPDGIECAAGSCEDTAFTTPKTCQAGQCTGGGGLIDCNGDNPCLEYACSAAGCVTEATTNGTACGASSCTAGMYTTAPVCDGFGACVAGGDALPCPGNFACMNGFVCRTACTTATDCIADHYCSGDGACLPLVDDGGSCSDDVMCASGYCDEGGLCCSGGDCCNAPADCPDDLEACTVNTCEDHVCGSSDLANGTACDDGSELTSNDQCVDGACGCVPDCSIAACGDDGCGGSCGDCEAGQECTPSGQCQNIDATGNTCLDPFEITSLPFLDVRDNTGQNNNYGFAAGDCPGVATSLGNGSNETVYVFTPQLTGVYTFEASGYDIGMYAATSCDNFAESCVEATDSAGSTGVETLTLSLTAGTTYFIFVDGYGNTSNVTGTFTFSVGQPCIPQCAGAECGPDSCGGVCGTCDSGSACTPDTQCTSDGNDCSAPLVVDQIPFSYQGDTTSRTNDFSTASGDCGEGTSALGGASNDSVFSFSPTVAGYYTIELSGTFDGTLYAMTTCGDPANSCGGSVDEVSASGTESLTIQMDAGSTWFIVVDGWSNTSNLSGTYTLTIDEPCLPTCAGAECGNDGCGGVCGTCDSGEFCSAGTCENPEDVVGNTCVNPIILPPTAPVLIGQDNTAFSDVFSLASTDNCAAGAGSNGAGLPDVVFSWTPTQTANYVLTMPNLDPGATPSLVHITTDCDPGTYADTCLGSRDFYFGGELEFTAESATTYYIVVDSFSSSEIGPFEIAIDYACLPQCDGVECGDDGCGGSCGGCGALGAAAECVAGTCECVPECEGLECGDNGCNGVCGTCPGGAFCDNGNCQAAIDGDVCEAAFVIADLPYLSNGNTSDSQNRYGPSAGECPGSAGAKGQGSNDEVYVLTAPIDGVYTIEVTGFDAAVYVTTDCTTFAGNCLAIADQAGSTATETLTVNLIGGVTYYIVVDGYANLDNTAGAYTIEVSEPCVPNCTDKNCGSDSCGGSCGTCTDGDLCAPDGVCTDPDNVLGNTCTNPVVLDGDLPFVVNADTSAGYSDDYSFDSASCNGAGDNGAGNPDMVFAWQATLSGPITVTLPGYVNFAGPSLVHVTTDCDPANYPAACQGALDFFGSGGFPGIEFEAVMGTTYYFVVDSYTAGEVGPFSMRVGEPCAPQCEGLTCGDDGCGGQCGFCDENELCTAGACIPVDQGDNCGSAYVIDPFELPFSGSGDTTVQTNVYSYGDNACPGDSSGQGAASNDEVWSLEVVESGIYTITVSGFDAAIYVVSSCTDIDATCLAGADNSTTSETVEVALEAGTTYFIIVDGYSDSSNIQGTYDITVSEPCVPSCNGAECGGDGCGGSCGECPDGQGCAAGSCTSAGDTCEDPYVVTSVPFTANGDTTARTNAYGFGADVCPGSSAAKGSGSNDEVYSFTPTLTGIYTVSVIGFDAALYIATDCADIDGTCLGGQDSTISAAEQITLNLDAGTTYFIFVDGYSTSSNVAGQYTLTITEPCVPSCDGFECGDDGCGSSCGECADGELCTVDQLCLLEGDVEGNTCENPFILDGPLPIEFEADNSNFSNNYDSDSDCTAGGTTGDNEPDVVFQWVATFDGNAQITIPNYVQGDGVSVIRVIEGADCDAALYGDTCLGLFDAYFAGGTPGFIFPVTAGVTYSIIIETVLAEENGPNLFRLDQECVPSCDGLECGTDGCFGTCGDCAGIGELAVCNGGFCECTPDCTGKECGADGCGGSCGDCFDDELCGDAQLCEPAPPGDVCGTAFVVDALPYEHSGTTSDLNNDYGFGDNVCPGETTGWGNGSNDAVYSFTPPETGTYTISAVGFDLVLYVLTDCGTIDETTCLVAEENTITDPEILTTTLEGGVNYFIVLDGYGNTSNTQGSYTFSISAPCFPECTGKACGPDGCGGSCGTCDEGDLCDPASGVCGSEDDVSGNTCVNPIEVPALPFLYDGDTSFHTNNFTADGGACEGETSTLGSASNDAVFTFVAPVDGVYRVTLASSFDSALYISTDCENVATTCVLAEDDAVSDNEVALFTATGGTTYFVFVDGYSTTTNLNGPFSLSIEEPCIPTCVDKECGSDGCGGDCGACGAGELCEDNFTCVPEGDKLGNTCANPIVVTDADFPINGDTSAGFTNDFSVNGTCTGTGSNGSGTPDVVYAWTPSQTGLYKFTMPGYTDFSGPSFFFATSDCDALTWSDTCLGLEDFFGNAEGEGPLWPAEAGVTYYFVIDSYDAAEVGEFTLDVQLDCIPSCDGVQCGDDGCGGSCGDCTEIVGPAAICNSSGLCACVPDCDGKVCGADGCGGTCGACADGQICDAGTCQTQVEGDACDLPILVDGLPFTDTQDTSIDFTNQYGHSAGSCDGTASAKGGGSPEVVYEFTPSITALYPISASGFDLALYIMTDCADVDGSCLAGADSVGSTGTEEIVAPLQADTTYYIVVDGYGTSSSIEGTFTLNIGEGCVPLCDGKECGDNGCGGLCGTCGPGTECDPAGQCVAVAGDTCDTAIDITAVPYTDEGSTSSALPDYQYGTGVCPGETGSGGAGSNDVTYAFTPVEAGYYDITVEGFDAALYVVTDCADIDATCVAGEENSISAPEEMTVFLEAGTTYFIIVDGYANSSNAAGDYTLTVSAPCVPACDGLECGDDGCGFSCGTCDAGPNAVCNAGICECTPDCTDKSCGGDGCGGSCGDCNVGEFCTGAGACEVLAAGDACQVAIPVGPLPFTDTQDLSDLNGFYGYSTGVCAGEEGGWGSGSNDVVYVFEPTADSTYILSVSGFDQTLYVVTNCEDIDNTCIAGSENAFGTGTEEVTLDAVAGMTYFVIVDGYGNTSNVTGTATFSVVDTACQPECTDKECGPDGCGGTCGTCGSGTECDGTGTCVSIGGDTCEEAIEVPALPYTHSGSTVGYGSDYGYSAGACPEEPSSGWGAGSSDVVYSFTADADGPIVVQVSGFDATLYAITDCADIDNTCVAGVDDAGSTGTEEITIPGVAGTTYFIVVDGYGNSSNVTGSYTITIEAGCVPVCDGAECGDDGCGGSCGTCDAGPNAVCNAGTCECTPDCTDKNCGGDGCGGSCGTCQATELCNESGVCEGLQAGETCAVAIDVPALPYTDTNASGDFTNEYGFSAGACPEEPSNGWGAGSSDVVYSYTPTEDGPIVVQVSGFDAVVYAITDCADIDNTCVAGIDDAGGTGTEEITIPGVAGTTYFIVVDGYGNSSNITGTYTVTIAAGCVPQCDGFECGDDGCGGSCGTCDAGPNAVCNAGTCECAPDCTDKNCGGDGCGGSCGTCEATEACSEAGICEALAAGETCETAIEVAALPYSDVFGDSSTFSNDYGYGTAVCPGETGSGGGGSNDVVYSYTATEDGPLIANLSGFDSALYVVTDCADIDGTCVAGSENAISGAETVEFPGVAGTTYFFIVDGWSNSTNVNGGYTFNIEAGCVPQCDGFECGDDGCGGSCGTCDAGPNAVCNAGTCECTPDCTDKNCGGDGCGGSCGTCEATEACSEAGICEALAAGETCATAIEVAALPYTDTGDSSTFAADYGYGTGVCPGETGSGGGASSDVVYSYTATEDGTLIASLVGFDAALYVVTDCADINGTCVAGAENTVGTPEVVEFAGVAGTTYFFIADGWSNSSNVNGNYTFTIEAGCTPQCDGFECGDDGCGGSCGTCDAGPNAVCNAGTCECTPDCTDKNCGGDGCGGSCGTCTAGSELCNGDGICEGLAAGDSCEVALPIAALPFSDTRDLAGLNGFYGFAEGECPGESGGWGSGSNDLVYSFTATTDTTLIATGSGFDLVLYTVTDCAAVGTSCVAGIDDSGSTGTEELTFDVVAGVTYFIIVDGYGNTSNITGEATFTLVDTACVPQCTDKVCGDDGCGGTCGSCDAGTACSGDGATCDEVVGNSCDTPFEVPALPYSDSNTTAGFGANYGYGTAACPGEEDSGGAASSDTVYAWTATFDGPVIATLEGFDAALYAMTDCADVDNSCQAGSENAFASGTEEITFNAVAGTTYFFVVDGWSNTTNINGSYDFTLDAVCVPQCAGLECGDDGCGGSCGTCDAGPNAVCNAGTCECTPDCTGKVCGDDGCGGSCGTCTAGTETCNPSGACDALPAGDTCELALPVVDLPFTDSGDTSTFGSDYGYGAGACPGQTLSGAAASSDVVYAWTAPNDAQVVATVSGFDATLYAVTDCGDVNGTCVGGVDETGSTGTETLSFTALGGTTYFFMVDGWSNGTNVSGSYTFTLDSTCIPQCTGKVCGDDGCGGTCGECAGDTSCNAAGDACVATMDLSGYTMTQTDSTQTYVFPEGTTVAPGTVIILARDADQAAFETFWGVTLGSDVLFINTGGAIPVINGAETYTLTDGDAAIVDGPTIAMSSGNNYTLSTGTGAPGDAGSWTSASATTGNGSPGVAGVDHSGIRITEFSDASGSGNFIYEFVEVSVQEEAVVAAVTFDQVAEIFEVGCGACHGSSGGQSIGNPDVNLAYAASQQDSYHLSGSTVGVAALARIQDGSMPTVGCTPGGVAGDFPPPCITVEEQALIQQWIDDGQLPPAVP